MTAAPRAAPPCAVPGAARRGTRPAAPSTVTGAGVSALGEAPLPARFASRALSQQLGVRVVPRLVRVSHRSHRRQRQRACPNTRSAAGAPEQALVKPVSWL